MNQRAQRLAELIHREIGSIARFETRDARFHQITVTAVRLSDDLGLAKVYFALQGSPEEIKTVTKALNNAQGFFRAKLGERVTMKYLPEIKFYIDESVAYGERIEQLFKEIRDDDP